MASAAAPSIAPAALFDSTLSPFDLKSSTVLITGGSSGIGLGLVPEFLNAGAKVIICGRREANLKEAQKKYPAVQYIVADVELASSRQQLYEDSIKRFPDLNILINNAGIQRTIPVVKDVEQHTDWSKCQPEIDINISAPIHLSTLFIPHLLKQKEAAIINVSSGLAFVPSIHAPIYCASKAAIHSYTLSLRLALHKTNIRVCELIPPAVKSNLGGSHDFGEETDVFCKAVFNDFAGGKLEFGYGFSEQGRLADRQQQQKMGLHMLNQMKEKYPVFEPSK